MKNTIWAYQLQVRVYQGAYGVRTGWRTVYGGVWTGSPAGRLLAEKALVLFREAFVDSHVVGDNVRLLVQPELEAAK